VRNLAPIVGALIATFSLGEPSGAQTLDLSSPAPLPALAEDNAVTRLARIVQEEIRSLEAESAGLEGREATILAARIAVRRIAFDLLARGGAEPLDRSVTAMEGLRLADLRRSLDVALAREFDGNAPPRPMRSRDRIERGLARFVEVAPRAMATPGLGETVALDAALATSLRPLVDALAVMSGLENGEVLGTGWPATLPRENLPRAVPAVAVPTGLAGVDAAFASSETLADSGRDEVLAFAKVAASCPWLDPADRTAIDAELAGLSVGVPEAELRVLRVRTVLANTIGSLGDDGRRRFEKLEPSVVGAARRALVVPAADRERLGLDRVERAIARMLEPITLAASTDRLAEGLPRDLRSAGRPLLDRAASADRHALAGLAEPLDRADALSDPAFVGRLVAQRDAHADLARLADVERLSRSIGGVRPQAAESLRRRLARAVRDLSDPTRRDRVAAALDALSTQVGRYLPLPFEESLRRETPEAIDLSAGQVAKLVSEIDLARANWADAWSLGRSSGPEATRLHDLWRLCRMMATVSTSTAPDRDGMGRLSSWGGFHATRSTLGPALIDATARVRLAALAASSDDREGDLRGLLAALERDLPIWLLASVLKSRLSAWLDRRPEPPLGLLAAVREPPEADAFGLESREDLATIARGVRELEELRRDGRDADAEALHSALSAIAERILATLGEETGSQLAAQPDLSAGETGTDDGRTKR
jgi:hypothetical protein